MTTGWLKTEENIKVNEFIGSLSEEQKQLLAQIIQQSRDGGIHDVLVYLNDEINLNGMKLIKNDIEIAKELLIQRCILTGYVEEKEIRGRIRRSSKTSYNIIF